MARERDFQFKFWRAQRYLDDLGIEEQGWFSKSLQVLPYEIHPDRPGYFIQYAIVQPIPVDPFALLIGDILHNLRGTLDHVAYTLAVNYHTDRAIPLPDNVKKDSQFPIFGDATDYAGKVGKYIGGIHPYAQTIIERCQPYHRGKHFAWHPLWMLQELANIDKHRLLLSSALNNISGVFRKETNFTLGEVIVNQGFLEGKAEIVTFSGWPIDPSKEVDVQYVPLVDIAFRCDSPLDGECVRSVLRGSIQSVAKVITDLDAFL